MKKGLFKFLVSVLIAVMCISAVSVSIYAADSDFDIVLNVGGETGYIQKYNGTDENVVIPSHTRSGVPITSIEMNAFSGNTYIKSVKVPDTVKVIEQNAFNGCTNLFSIDLPDTLERIEWNVFKNTAFYNNSNVWFDYTLYIDGYLIENRHTGRDPVNIAFGTKGIAEGAFATSCVTSLNIPKSVRFIGESAFNDVFYLEEFTVDSESPYYKSIDGVLFTTDNKLVRYPYRKADKSYMIPDGTKSIANHGFADVTNLIEMYIPASVSAIDRFAFLNHSSSLQNVMVDSNSEHFKSINGVLYTADGKTLVYYPQGKKEKKLVVPDGVTDVAHLALRYNKYIEEIVFGEDLKRVEEFSYLENLHTITFPASVEYFDRFCFSGCYNLGIINFRGTEEQWKSACGRYTFAEGATINFLYDDSTVPATETTAITEPVMTEPEESTSVVGTTVSTEPVESTTAEVTTSATDPVESTIAEVTTTVMAEPEESTSATVTTTAEAVVTTTANVTETATSTAPKDEAIKGDVNLDGKLNIRDATLIQKYLAKMAEFNEKVLALADMDTNGKVNIKDATYIQKKLANII